jgi:hypothetical protein
LNQAVAYFGQYIEAKMDEAEENLSKGKRQPKKDAVARARMNVLTQYGIKPADAPRKFADPALMF